MVSSKSDVLLGTCGNIMKVFLHDHVSPLLATGSAFDMGQALCYVGGGPDHMSSRCQLMAY